MRACEGTRVSSLCQIRKGKLPDSHTSWVNRAEPKWEREIWRRRKTLSSKRDGGEKIRGTKREGEKMTEIPREIWESRKRERKKLRRRAGRGQQEIPSSFSRPFVLQKLEYDNTPPPPLFLSHATPPSFTFLPSIRAWQYPMCAWRAYHSQQRWLDLKSSGSWRAHCSDISPWMRTVSAGMCCRCVRTSCLPAGHIQSGV